MTRLFVAVAPPDDVLDRVAALDRPPVPGLRWTTRAQWHVTLRFLGDADLAEVVAALDAVSWPAPVVDVEIGPAVGRFDHRVLHLPVSGLTAVAAGTADATAHLGRAPEDRPFAGHLTVARVGRGARVDLRPLTGAPLSACWTVDEICLVQSRLSPTGARYDVVERFPLAGG